MSDLDKYKSIPVHEFSDQDEQLREDQRFDLFPLLVKTGKSSTEPHRHDYYELFFFTNGGGTHLVDFQELPIDACSAHIVAPQQVHHLKRSNNSVGYAIMFMESFLRNNLENRHFVSQFAYMEQEDYVPVFQFTSSEYQEIEQLLGIMEAEMKKGECTNIEILQHYQNILILKCRTKKTKRLFSHLSADQLLYAEFRKQVDLNYKTVKKVKDYAQLLNTTDRQLNEISHKGCGKSASTVIYERIVMEAMRLMVNTEMSVKEICYELEYDDLAHFSKFFKSQSGYSPSQFRELYK